MILPQQVSSSRKVSDLVENPYIIQKQSFNNDSLQNSFENGLERRHFIARNNLRMNAIISSVLILA